MGFVGRGRLSEAKGVVARWVFLHDTSDLSMAFFGEVLNEGCSTLL